MKKLILVLVFFWNFLNALEIPQTSKYDKKSLMQCLMLIKYLELLRQMAM